MATMDNTNNAENTVNTENTECSDETPSVVETLDEPSVVTEISSCSSSSEAKSDSVVINISETSSITTRCSEPTSTTHSTTSSKILRRAKSSKNLVRYQRHILSLTNALRAKHDAPPVVLNAQLNEAARLHNADIALVIRDLSHVSSDGRTLTERLLEQGYDFRYASENLARGQRNCEWVMSSWMKSPGHRRNILNPRVREMGLHVGLGGGKMYWSQVFGIRRG